MQVLLVYQVSTCPSAACLPDMLLSTSVLQVHLNLCDLISHSQVVEMGKKQKVCPGLCIHFWRETMSSVKQPRKSVTSREKVDGKEKARKKQSELLPWSKIWAWQVVCDTFDSHRHSYAQCSSVSPLISACTIKELRKIRLVDMNTSDSPSLREMGSLIVGVTDYCTLHLPVFIAQGDRKITTVQLALTETGQEGYWSRKIAHKCCFRCCCRITKERSSRGSYWQRETKKKKRFQHAQYHNDIVIIIACSSFSALSHSIGCLWISLLTHTVFHFTVGARFNLLALLHCQKQTRFLGNVCWSCFCIWAIWLSPAASCSAEHEYKS